MSVRRFLGLWIDGAVEAHAKILLWWSVSVGRLQLGVDHTHPAASARFFRVALRTRLLC